MVHGQALASSASASSTSSSSSSAAAAAAASVSRSSVDSSSVRHHLALHDCRCADAWTWDVTDSSPEAQLVDTSGSSGGGGGGGGSSRTVVFHPSWSNGTAAIRGTKPLDNDTVSYWQVLVCRRLFATSLQFGVATKSARLHVNAFINLLGEDEHSWALSHKGTLWHRGRCCQYTAPFREDESTTVGLLYNGPRRTLTYFKDGVCLGVAFTGLPTAQSLYPAVCSTAAKTRMTLTQSLRSYTGLQDRCRSAITRQLLQSAATLSPRRRRRLDQRSAAAAADTELTEVISALPLPPLLRHYIASQLRQRTSHQQQQQQQQQRRAEEDEEAVTTVDVSVFSGIAARQRTARAALRFAEPSPPASSASAAAAASASGASASGALSSSESRPVSATLSAGYWPPAVWSAYCSVQQQLQH